MTDQNPTTGGPGPEPLLQEAAQLAEEGEWGEAYQRLHQALDEYPNDPTVLCMLGVAAGQVGSGGIAYEYFRRCLAEQPQDPALLVTLGTELARYDDPDAEGVLRLAALTAPDLATARLHYGAYLAREGMLDLAREELRVARELEPDSPQVARELGVVALLSGAAAQGAEELERALGLDHDNQELRVLYALALLQERRLEEAAEEIHRAAVQLTSDGEVQLLAALACATQEWWDEAWDALARAELAEFPAESAQTREVEEALEAGADASEAALHDEFAPSMLRERLFERP